MFILACQSHSQALVTKHHTRAHDQKGWACEQTGLSQLSGPFWRSLPKSYLPLCQKKWPQLKKVLKLGIQKIIFFMHSRIEWERSKFYKNFKVLMVCWQVEMSAQVQKERWRFLEYHTKNQPTAVGCFNLFECKSKPLLLWHCTVCPTTVLVMCVSSSFEIASYSPPNMPLFLRAGSRYEVEEGFGFCENKFWVTWALTELSCTSQSTMTKSKS